MFVSRLTRVGSSKVLVLEYLYLSTNCEYLSTYLYLVFEKMKSTCTYLYLTPKYLVLEVKYFKYLKKTTLPFSIGSIIIFPRILITI